jgi:uncharacterized peroxidase-related enzyme
MSIKPIASEKASRDSQQIFGELRTKIGMVPNLFQVIGHSASALKNFLSFDQGLSQDGLSKRELELINLHVSELNGCGYCLSAHTAIAAGAGLGQNEILDARNGRSQAAKEQALLNFVRRIVRTGGATAQTELSELREHGYSDSDVVNIIAAISLKHFTNAVAIVSQVEIDFPRAKSLPKG